MTQFRNFIQFILLLLMISFLACGTSQLTYYFDPNMDFGSLRAVAVMPFENLTRDDLAAERVRDIFANSLLATGAVYVVPPGEVARAIVRTGIVNPQAPSAEEIGRLGKFMNVDALITGVIREYGEVRSGATTANVISLSLQMIEVQSKQVIWTASSTKGGVSIWDRLFGGGGDPMNDVTMAAINDILNKLFQ